MEPTSTAIENFDRDLNRLQALADALEEYILGNETYRTLLITYPHGNERTTMSGGQLLALLNLLLRARANLTAEQQTRLDGLTTKIQQTSGALRTPFHKHLTKEAKSNLDRLRWFLDSCQEDPQQCQRDFSTEIQNRQRLEEIEQAFAGELPAEIAHDLASIDSRIRAISKPGEFIWPQRTKELYPRDPYWYLYVTV